MKNETKLIIIGVTAAVVSFCVARTLVRRALKGKMKRGIEGLCTELAEKIKEKDTMNESVSEPTPPPVAEVAETSVTLTDKDEIDTSSVSRY